MSELRTTRAFQAEVEQLAQKAVNSGEKVEFAERDEAVRTSVVQALIERTQNVVVARVPTDPDQIERVSLDIAGQLGVSAVRDVDEALRRQTGQIGRLLGEHLGERELVVDGRDHVGDFGAGTDEAVRVALRAELADLAAFLDRRAKFVIRSDKPSRPFAGGGTSVRTR